MKMNEEKIKEHREELWNERRYLREFIYKWNEEIMSWLENTWAMHRYDLENESWKLEWILLRWWAPENQTEKTPEMLWMGEKNSHNRKQLWEDGIKLELRIFGRTGKDLRGTLLRSSNVENDDGNHPELWRYSGRMKNKGVEPTIKIIWNRSWKTSD